jgi:methanogenic corrinoid protein MtbC1
MNKIEWISIGQLSKLSGLAVLRLRTWEDRYGIPKAERRPSGHRRYPAEELRRVQVIQQLLELGFKIGKICNNEIAELELLLENELRSSQALYGTNHQVFVDKHRWGDLIRSWNDQGFLSELEREYERFTPAEFAEFRMGPFLSYLGEQWAVGGLSVAQEHFASDCLEYFISTKWRARNTRLTEKPLVLAMLSGDHHTLGLQLCALITAQNNRRVIYLGARTPIHEIVKTAEYVGADGVVISISSLMDIRTAEKQLFELRQILPEKYLIIAGGKGAPKGVKGVMGCASFLAFDHWLESVSGD